MTQTLEQKVTLTDPAAIAAEAALQLPPSGPEMAAAEVAATETASVGAVALVGEAGAPMGRFARLSSMIREMAASPDVRAGALGVARLAGNIAVSTADVVPVVGEVVSGAADLGKFTGRSPFNLSPDVPRTVALASEVLEPFRGGVAPSHLVETVWQAKHDAPQIRAGWRVARSILAGNRPATPAPNAA